MSSRLSVRRICEQRLKERDKSLETSPRQLQQAMLRATMKEALVAVAERRVRMLVDSPCRRASSGWNGMLVLGCTSSARERAFTRFVARRIPGLKPGSVTRSEIDTLDKAEVLDFVDRFFP